MFETTHTTRWCRHFCVVICLAIVAAACGTDDTDALADPPRDRREELVSFENAPPFQERLIADGRVSFSEYEEAFFAAVQCTSDAGVAVDPPQLSPDGIQYATTFDNVPVDGRQAGEIWEECHREYLELVELMYIDSVAPTLEEQLAQLQEIADCLGDLGLTVGNPTSPSDLVVTANVMPESKELCFPPSFFGGGSPPNDSVPSPTEDN